MIGNNKAFNLINMFTKLTILICSCWNQIANLNSKIAEDTDELMAARKHTEDVKENLQKQVTI